MLKDIPAYGPVLVLLVIALLVLGVAAFSRLAYTRAVHRQQREAWRAHRAWLDSATPPPPEAEPRRQVRPPRPQGGHP